MKMKNFSFLQNTDELANTISVSHAGKVQAALVSLVYSQTLIGLMASLFCATIIVFGLYNPETKGLLFSWYAFFLAISFYRFVFSLIYSRQQNPEKNLAMWKNIFIVGALLGGISWGLVGVMVYPVEHVSEQILIVLVLSGVTAGAVSVLSGILNAALAFIIPALLPLIFYLVYLQTDLILDTTIAVYLVYLVVLSRKTHETIKAAYLLQFKNNDLLSDLSEAKKQLEIINKKLEQAATHDPLTNVANRNLFVNYFTKAIELAKKNKKILALLYMDIDSFKTINDTHGHHVGDQLLLTLVERLGGFVDNMDLIARLGGDEFAIILENVSDPNEIAKIAKQICHDMSKMACINNLEIKFTTSIGIGVYPIDGDSPEVLLSISDRAMYYVKNHGGNNFRFNVTLLAG